MSSREILSIGHPTLRVRSAPVPKDQIGSAEVQQLIDDLIETMRAANGAGLAANQIGSTKRVVVMEVVDNPRYPYKPQLPLTVALNPVIEPVGDETFVVNEGCLSVPLRGDVERFLNIRVRYTDRDGVDHEEHVRGLSAGTWQHECDHLDGILMVDRVIDPTTLSTWDQFELHHRDAFVERITRFVDEVGA